MPNKYSKTSFTHILHLHPFSNFKSMVSQPSVIQLQSYIKNYTIQPLNREKIIFRVIFSLFKTFTESQQEKEGLKLTKVHVVRSQLPMWQKGNKRIVFVFFSTMLSNQLLKNFSEQFLILNFANDTHYTLYILNYFRKWQNIVLTPWSSANE